MLQRFYRLKDAPKYLGMDKNTFNRDIRPELSVIRLGKAVLFDRMELDAWADYTKSRCGRPPRRRAKWHKEEHQGSANAVVTGISRRSSEGTEPSMSQLAKQISERRRPTSPSDSKRSDV
jgi:hypothetical protein